MPTPLLQAAKAAEKFKVSNCNEKNCKSKCLMTKVVIHRRRSASLVPAHSPQHVARVRGCNGSRYLIPTKYPPRSISLETLTTRRTMSGMVPYKPAPKNSTSANRIRERYLHQLGLQRGAVGGAGGADPLSSSQHYRAMLAQQNHVVVISGLPSLPEDRPSNPVTVMESHDYSTSRHTYHSITTLGSEILISDELSYDDGTADADDRMDDSAHDGVVTDNTTSALHFPHMTTASRSTKNQKHCQQQQQTTSSTPCNESLLHKALAYPPGGVHMNMLFQPPNKSTSTTPTPLSHPPELSFPWQSRGNGVACNTLLDLTDGGDSVKSECTSTTAESSYHRDHRGGCGMSATSIITQGGKQPGVVNGGGAARNSGNTNNCPTSSLTTELHGFNIDSDCEASSVATLASIATTSTTHRSEGGTSSPLSTADGDTTKTTNTVASHQSSKSSRSAKSSSSGSSRKKKLLLRATAHERILKIRSDQSSKMRADVVHTQRQGVGACIGDDYDADDSKTRQHQQQLRHLNLQAASQDVMSRTPPTIPGRLSYIDHGSGRTPVASNCSDALSNLRKLREIEKNYKHLFPYSSLWGNSSSSVGGGEGGEGVHIALPSPPCLTTGVYSTQPSRSSSISTGILHNSRPNPLSPHPQLTSTTPNPTMETNSNTTAVPSWSIDPISSTSFALQHKNYTTNSMVDSSSSTKKNSSSTRNYHHERTPSVERKNDTNLSLPRNSIRGSNYRHERTPSVDEDLLEVAISLAGMKRSG